MSSITIEYMRVMAYSDVIRAHPNRWSGSVCYSVFSPPEFSRNRILAPSPEEVLLGETFRNRHCDPGDAGVVLCPCTFHNLHMCWGHQPNNRGLYTHCKDSVLKLG